ncbi:MAG: trypsin-like peptidase domain-containing protein [Bryobacter sp.]|nr:trypsin-like peptidase domain-containing protein [Bryobacter sp.]
MRIPAFLLFVCAILSAQATLPNLSSQFQELVARTNPGVVQILVKALAAEADATPLVRSQRGNGSGAIVSADGYIVTNAHVVANARRIQALIPQRMEQEMSPRSILKPAGKLVEAKLVGLDRETDIAVLKVDESNLPTLSFGDSEALQQGQLVFAFGSPLGLDNSVTMGIVSSVARQVRLDDPMIYIQTDASINPGNSGGPLVDSQGAVVGINTFILSNSGGSEGIGFAAPSNIVRTVYNQIREHGRVRRGQIGVLSSTISPQLARALSLPQDSGVLIEDVLPGGAAAAAGVEIGDIVLTLNGKPMENSRQLGVNIYQNARQTVEFEILRRGEKKSLRVAVLERPEDPDRLLDLLQGVQSRIPQLGILAINLDEKAIPLYPNLRKYTGVVVAGLTSDLAIDQLHLAPGDIIHEVNRTVVTDLAGLRRAIEGFKHGDIVALQIERQGRLAFVLLEVD